MLGSLVGFLFIGFVLTIFDLDKILVRGFNELFKTKYTTNVYWFVLVALGLFVGLVHEIFN